MSSTVQLVLFAQREHDISKSCSPFLDRLSESASKMHLREMSWVLVYHRHCVWGDTTVMQLLKGQLMMSYWTHGGRPSSGTAIISLQMCACSLRPQKFPVYEQKREKVILASDPEGYSTCPSLVLSGLSDTAVWEEHFCDPVTFTCANLQ